MAHLINSDKDFVTLREKAWHGLGTIVEQEMSINEALQLGGLNFEVAKAPNVHRLPDGSEVVSKNSFFTYRTDNHLILGDTLGKQYTPLQNHEAFGLLENVVNQAELVIETAGILEGGKKVFMCCRQQEPMLIRTGVNEDPVYQYLVMANGHDGELSAMAYFSTIRVVCNNTLTASRWAGNFINKQVIRHTTNVKANYKAALKMIGVLRQNHEVLTEAYDQMAKTRLSKKQFFDYLGNIFFSEEEIRSVKAGKKQDEVLSTQKQKLMANVIEYCHEGVGQDVAQEMTSWWAYNGITGYLHNTKEYKTQERKMTGLLWGDEAKTNKAAFNLAYKPETIKSLSPDILSRFSLN